MRWILAYASETREVRHGEGDGREGISEGAGAVDALDGNVLANTWEGTWTDRETGKAMAGRGVEVWAMRDGMIAVWDAAFNIWEAGGERKSPVM